MMARTHKRADSRALPACPLCGRKQHGLRGLKAHLAAVHPDAADFPSPVASQPVSPTEGGDLERAESPPSVGRGIAYEYWDGQKILRNQKSDSRNENFDSVSSYFGEPNCSPISICDSPASVGETAAPLRGREGESAK
jgi:hypothetical protein